MTEAMSFLQQQQQQQPPQAKNSESCANVFNSLDFGKFLSKEFPKDLGGSDPFLSKDTSLPTFEVPSVFKSKDAFSKMFSSSDWEMKFSKPEPQPARAPPIKTMPTATVASKPEGSKAALQNILTSREWMPMNTLGQHIDVSYSRDMFGGSVSDSELSTPTDGDLPRELPPHRTKWDKMFFSQLQLVPPQVSSSDEEKAVAPLPQSNQVLPDLSEEQSAVPEQIPIPTYSATDEPADVPNDTAQPAKKKRKRKPRKKVVPEKKIYVEPVDNDVLLGRGGRSNHHPGNKRYREEVKNLQKWYLDIEDKDEKTDLSQCLVDYVKSYNGRFLEKDNFGWYEVPNIVARRKASQALREDTDPEKRKAKRARFLKKKAEKERVGSLQAA